MIALIHFTQTLEEIMRLIYLQQSKTIRLLHAICLLGLALVPVYGQSPTVSPTPESPVLIERALGELDKKWSDAAGAKDIDKVVAYYASNALVLPSNAPAATTKEAIRAIWKDLLTTPGNKISWKPVKIEAAKSGELAYVTGTYQLTMNDAKGKPAKEKGKYVEVFKKQNDGSWKVIVDIWNSDLPAAAPTGKN
jgi:ketosteroid isomerase-like protein